jgi:hypothetical protein
MSPSGDFYTLARLMVRFGHGYAALERAARAAGVDADFRLNGISYYREEAAQRIGATLRGEKLDEETVPAADRTAGRSAGGRR